MDDKCTKLSGKKCELFHIVVAKLLYIMKRARPEIEPLVSHICTQVTKCDEDCWKKLRRISAGRKCTIDDNNIIGASDLSIIFTWIDAVYIVHNGMMSQTDESISMGHGVLHCKSANQKLNGKSSTYKELVGTSDYGPYSLWLIIFMGEQGYPAKDNIIYRDNQSEIIILKNGKNSCRGNYRKVHIIYFFIKEY